MMMSLFWCLIIYLVAQIEAQCGSNANCTTCAGDGCVWHSADSECYSYSQMDLDVECDSANVTWSGDIASCDLYTDEDSCPSELTTAEAVAAFVIAVFIFIACCCGIPIGIYCFCKQAFKACLQPNARVHQNRQGVYKPQPITQNAPAITTVTTTQMAPVTTAQAIVPSTQPPQQVMYQTQPMQQVVYQQPPGGQQQVIYQQAPQAVVQGQPPVIYQQPPQGQQQVVYQQGPPPEQQQMIYQQQPIQPQVVYQPAPAQQTPVDYRQPGDQPAPYNPAADAPPSYGSAPPLYEGGDTGGNYQ